MKTFGRKKAAILFLICFVLMIFPSLQIQVKAAESPIMEKTDEEAVFVEAKNIEALHDKDVDIIGETMIVPLDEGETLKIGDIMTLPPSEEHPFGLARKVEAIHSDEHYYYVETSEPLFEELVSDLTVSETIPLQEEYVETASLPEGVTVANYYHSDEKQSFIDGLEYTLDNVSINIGGQEVFVNGFIRLAEANVDVDYEFSRFTFQKFSMVFNSKVQSELQIRTPNGIKIDEDQFEKEVILGELNIPIPYLPAVGVSFKASSILEGSLQGDMETAFSNEVIANIGIVKDENGFRPVNNLENNTNFTIDGKGSTHIQAGLKTDISSYLFSVDFATLTSKLGIYGEAEAFAEMPLHACVSGEYGLFTNAHFKLSIGRQSLFDSTFLDYRLPLGSLQTCSI